MDASKKTFKNIIIFLVIEYLVFCIVWLIFITCKKKYTSTKLPKEPCIVVFWHGRLAMMCFAYRKWWLKDFKNKKIGKVIISNHKDGEIIARIVSHFKIGAIRGSSSKGGANVLKKSFGAINNGIDIIITPDGPRGPKHSIADGAVVLAQKKNLMIYALNYEASNYWQFKSWDAMILPKPFSTINYSLSEPFDVGNMSLEEGKSKILDVLLNQAKKDNIF